MTLHSKITHHIAGSYGSDCADDDFDYIRLEDVREFLNELLKRFEDNFIRHSPSFRWDVYDFEKNLNELAGEQFFNQSPTGGDASAKTPDQSPERVDTKPETNFVRQRRSSNPIRQVQDKTARSGVKGGFAKCCLKCGMGYIPCKCQEAQA